MTREQRLRSEARAAATWRGHTMQRQWCVSEFHGRNRQSIKCLKCGRHAIICLKPLPNEIDIGGEAVAVGCSD
jgi:hypothetical protein